MASDFTKAIYNDIAKEFNSATDADKKLKILEKRITLGRGTQKDVAQYAERLGKHAADAFNKVVPAALPEGQLYYGTADSLIRPIMANIHSRVNTAAIIEQATEDAKNGLKINIVKGSDGAINTLVNDVSAAQDYTAVMNNEAVTTAHKFYDEFQQENLQIRDEMGYEQYVVREYDDVGLHNRRDVCQFCKQMEGTYEYPDECFDGPYTVFSRHDGCGCMITFHTKEKTTKQTEWQHNKWE